MVRKFSDPMHNRINSREYKGRITPWQDHDVWLLRYNPWDTRPHTSFVAGGGVDTYHWMPLWSELKEKGKEISMWSSEGPPHVVVVPRVDAHAALSWTETRSGWVLSSVVAENAGLAPNNATALAIQQSILFCLGASRGLYDDNEVGSLHLDL